MAYTKKIKAGLVPVSTEEFIGDAGTLFYDPDVGDLYLSDGVTPGGTLLSSGGGGGAGPRGYTGSIGYTGSQGASGTNGYTGSRGDAGYVGSAGATGASGIQGTTGYAGSAGAAGPAGATGPAGSVGYTGSAGTAGANGNTGATGSLGYTGSAGAGYTGSAGANGSNGTTGYTGSVGSVGPAGSLGATGANGGVGATGLTGNVGATGVQGATGIGATGPTGATGAKGDTGAQGVSVTLQGTKATIADLPLTGNPGDGWIVTTGDGGSHLNGSLWFWNVVDQVWNDIGPIVGPQGDLGAQGNTGATGLSGDTGATGPQGDIGATGPMGDIGATGMPGDMGATGMPGDTGATGISFIWRSEWNGSYYVPNDVVSYQGSSYICIVDNADTPPTNTNYWQLVAQKGADGGNANTGNFVFTNDELSVSDNGNVTVVTNGNTWTLGTNGTLTLPQTNMTASPAPISLPGITFTDGSLQTTAFKGWAIDASNGLNPLTDNLQDIGTPTQRVRHIYVGPGSVTIGNSIISESTTGKLVLPGVTRATTLFADEVEDEGDQTYSFSTNPFLLDAYTFGVSTGNITADPSYSPAEYDSNGINGDGYINDISVYTPGVWTQAIADYNRNNDMYGYIGSNIQEQPFNPSNWVQIPFRVRAKANDVEYEFNTGGGGSGAELTSGDNNFTLSNSQNGRLTLSIDSDDKALFQINEDNDLLIDSLNGDVIISANDSTEYRFGSNGTLTLPSGGDIKDSNGNSVLGAGAGTGNISFDSSGNSAGIYNNQGGEVIISNFSFITDEAETAYVRIPAGDSSNALQIVQEQGSVEIHSINKIWEFSSNGALRLPEGGDILDSNGASVLGGGGTSVAGLTGNTSFTPGSSGDTAYELDINNQIKLRTTYSGNLGPGIGLGNGAGQNAATGVIAIGNNDVGLNGKQGGVYIGFQAGWNDSEQPQGEYAIAIGARASRNIARDNTIVLNATGDVLDAQATDGLYIKPIREEVENTAKALYYDTATGEVTYADPTSAGGSSTVARQDTPPSASNGTLWFNTLEGRLYIKYSNAWVDAAPLVMPAPEQNPDFTSITFPDATVQTTAFTGNKLVNGVHELVLNTNGDLLSANDIIATPDGRFIKDCGGSTSTTSMRWNRVPTDTEVELIRVYTGNEATPDDIERAKISLEWQTATESGLSITAFDYTDGSDEYKWDFTGIGDLVVPGDIRTTNPLGIFSENGAQSSGLDITGGAGSIVYATTDVIIRSDNNGTPKDWTFGSNGRLTLPGAVANSTVAKTGGGIGTETAIDLTKTVNKLTDGVYTLADGVEGQIMYLVRQTGASYNTVTVMVANARISGAVYTAIAHAPFQGSSGVTQFDMDTLIFTDGAWQANSGAWD